MTNPGRFGVGVLCSGSGGLSEGVGDADTVGTSPVGTVEAGPGDIPLGEMTAGATGESVLGLSSSSSGGGGVEVVAF